MTTHEHAEAPEIDHNGSTVIGLVIIASALVVGFVLGALLM